MIAQISVRNLQREVPVKLSALRKSAETALGLVAKVPPNKATQLKSLEEIFVLLISDRRMAGLHNQYLHQSGPTDVITFNHGEIFISVETARRNARQFGTSLQRELELYVIHGLLHLHGFDDNTPGDARTMERTQEKILRSLN